jgi:dynein heavy chain
MLHSPFRWWKATTKLLKTVTGEAAPVAQTLRSELEDFRQYVPLITALRNPGLKDRHWSKISSIVGASVRPDERFSLCVALSMGLKVHLTQIEEISASASKEYSLEKSLDKLQVCLQRRQVVTWYSQPMFTLCKFERPYIMCCGN